MRKQIFFFLLVITVIVFYFSYDSPEIKEMQFPKKKINIFNATKDELITLKGMGDKKAEKIINYRNKHNLKKEDLINIIGKKTFDNISSLIIFLENH